MLRRTLLAHLSFQLCCLVLPSIQRSVNGPRSMELSVEGNVIRSFTFFDSNGDGVITSAEFASKANKLGINQPADTSFEKKISLYDADKNGSVDLNEFMKVIHDPDISVKKMGEFLLLDKNRDGMITITEMYDGFVTLFGDFIPPDLIHEVLDADMKKDDLNGDNLLSYAEFNVLKKN